MLASSTRVHGRACLLAGAAPSLARGLLGLYRYLDNYWLYRGFAPPPTPAYVHAHGTATRFYLSSAALAGRRQPVDVYLPPGYARTRTGATRCSTCCTASRAGPARSSHTVRMGVVEDELVARHRMKPLILVMPFGSTGSSRTRSGRTVSDKATAGRPSSPATSSARSTPATARSAPRRARALAGLSEGGYGAFNIGLHHPGEFRVLESWSGYERADDLGTIFGHRRPSCARTARSDTRSSRARAAAHAHLPLVLQRH